jgi:hypothetical protein
MVLASDYLCAKLFGRNRPPALRQRQTLNALAAFCP